MCKKGKKVTMAKKKSGSPKQKSGGCCRKSPFLFLTILSAASNIQLLSGHFMHGIILYIHIYVYSKYIYKYVYIYIYMGFSSVLFRGAVQVLELWA